MMSTVLVFWCSAFVLLYTYAGFALIVICYGALRRRHVRKAAIAPSVSLIIAAYNEEHSIADKLENSLHLDYPTKALEIIVASDGSDDLTNSIVEEYARYGVRLLVMPRKGKLTALNNAVARAGNEILVFSDANALLDAQALRLIVRNFADPQIGGVCGNQIYVNGKTGDSVTRGERAYWQYDKWLKALETQTGSIVSADGSVYAIRRKLYRKPESLAVTDDFAISTAVVEQGYRLIFEPDAVAYESPAPSAEREFGRKVRIINRGLRGVLLRKRLLNPFRYGFYSVTLFSHKLLRRFAPFFLVALFTTSILLSLQSSFYFAVALAQIAFYGLALISFGLRNTALGHWKILYVPFFYCLANTAALVAVIKLVVGTRIELWQPQR